MSLYYVLITPARNEEAFIEKTIQSVIAQTVLPKKWIIVSDGSTDKTDEIVKKYLPDHPWMELIRMPDVRERSFAAKVGCFNAGFERVKKIGYDVIGNLDADISFEPDYFEFLLSKFSNMPDLGVAGTPFIENGYSSSADSYEGEIHVAGGCQLFRDRCFEEVGGYIPIKGGGIDWVAVTSARMKGWETRSFKDKYFYHWRSLGTANKNVLRANFDYGKKDHFLGGHPLWEAFRVTYRMTKKPYIVGGLALLSGYVWSVLTNTKRPITQDLIRFHRAEQLSKLQTILKSALRLKKVSKYST